MKRRWLIALTAIVLTITMCMGFAACGQSDADTAKDAIETIQAMYKDQIPAETATDFKVVGQTKVEEQVYTVNWSVTSSTENITDYVKIGTMDETTKLITIGITKGADVINYTLTASVTVGDATESVSFERKIPAKAKDAAGTEDDPYSVARALEIANSLEPNDYFGGKKNPTRVYVHGYIVDCGKQFNETRISYVYIVDEYDDSKTSKSPDAFDIYSITYDEVNCTCQEDLTKGAEIVVSGYIMLYQKSGQTTTQPELTYFGDGNVTCSYLEKKERTPDEKVALALSKVESNLTVSKAGEFELPTSTVKDVTFAWKTESTTYPLTTDGKKLQVSALPTEDATVTLTLTATCGTASDTKTVTVTVKAAGANDGSVEKPFTVAEALEIGSKLASGKFYQVDGKNAQVHIAGYVTDVGTVNTYNGEVKGLQNVLIADEKGGTETLKLSFVYWNDVMEKPADASNPLKVGDYVVVYGFLENYNNNVNVYYSGGVYPEFTTWNEKVSQQQPVGPGEDEEEVFTAITSPEEGTYIMGMVVEDTVYYLKGGMNEFYLATSSDPQDAVEVTLAVSGDGYVIKCGAQFIEVETSGTHINAVYKDAQTAGKVWKWNEEHQLFTMDEGGKTYYLGNYWKGGNNYPYNTIGASDFSQYSETKQYHARLGNFAAPVEPEPQETDQDKVNKAKEAFTLETLRYNEVKDYPLPAQSGEATLSWAMKEGTTSTNCTVEGNQLKVTSLPVADEKVTLTVTFTINQATATKDIEITLVAAGVVEPTTYDVTASYSPFLRGHTAQESLNGKADKIKDVTIAYSKASGTTNPAFYTDEVRVYHNGTVTVSVPEGYLIVKITLTFTASDGNTVSATVGTLAGKVWTGSEQSVVFTVGAKSDGSNGGHIKLTKVDIEYKSPEAECTHTNLEKTDEVPAACGKTGVAAYWTCQDCERMFSAQTAKDEEEIFIPVVTEALEHVYSKWTDKGDGLHHTSTCDLCQTPEEEMHDKLGEGGVCSKCGGTVTAATKDVTVTLDLTSLGLNDTSYAANNKEHEVDGVKFETYQMMLSQKLWQAQKTKAYLINKDAFAGRIKSITIVFDTSMSSGNLTLQLGATSDVNEKTQTITMSGTQTFTADEGTDFRFFKLSSPTATCKLTSIVIVYETLETSASINSVAVKEVALPGKEY